MFIIEKDKEDCPEDVQLTKVINMARKQGFEQCRAGVLFLIKDKFSNEMDELMYLRIVEELMRLNG